MALALAAGPLGGCATAWHAYAQRDAKPTVEAAEAGPDGRRVTVTPARQADPVWALLGLDAFVAANGVRAVLTFGTDLDAMALTALAAGGGMGLDLAGLGVVRALAPVPKALLVPAANGGDPIQVPLVARDGRYEAWLPTGLLPPGHTARIGVADAGGTVLASADITAPALPVAPSPPPVAELPSDVDAPLARSAELDPDAVALVVGVEQHGNDVPEAAYAARDAAAATRYMTEAFGVDRANVIQLVNEQATGTNLRVAVERRLANRVTPGKSSVYVYFAGHGVTEPKDRQAYLVPYDGDPKYPADSCYPTASLYQALGRLGAKRSLVILDACFTGVAGRSTKPTALAATLRPLMISPITRPVPKGVLVLAASAADEASAGLPEQRHGLFTYWLLKGLRGDGQAIGTVGDAFAYAREQVVRGARLQDREQTPSLAGEGAGSWKLIR